MENVTMKFFFSLSRLKETFCILHFLNSSKFITVKNANKMLHKLRTFSVILRYNTIEIKPVKYNIEITNKVHTVMQILPIYI